MSKNYSTPAQKKARTGAIWLSVGCVVAALATGLVIFNGVTKVSKLFESQDLAVSLSETLNKRPSFVKAEDLSKVEYLEVFENSEDKTLNISYGLADFTAEMNSESEDKDPSKFLHSAVVDAEGYSFSDLKLFTGVTSATVYTSTEFDLNNLINCTKLETLTTYSSVTGLDALSSLAAVKNLTLSAASELDFDKLSAMTALESLSFSGTVTNPESVSKLTSLKECVLSSSGISDLTPFASLKNLETLGIESSNISDLSPLKDNTKLSVISFSQNQITDASAIASMPELKTVYLNNNQISDVSALTSLNTEKLETLNLTGNPITDLTPLDYLGDKLVFTVPEATPEEDAATSDAAPENLPEGAVVGEDGSITLSGDALQQYIDETGMEGVKAAMPEDSEDAPATEGEAPAAEAETPAENSEN